MLLTAQHLVGAHDVSSVPPRRSRGPAGPAASPRVPRAGGLGVGHTEGDQHVVSAATAERGGERPRAWRRRRRWLELPAGEHRQVVVAVSASRCSTWSRAGSLVHRSLVTGGEGGLDHGAAHKTGAADEEDTHMAAVLPRLTRPGAHRGPPRRKTSMLQATRIAATPRPASGSTMPMKPPTTRKLEQGLGLREGPARGSPAGSARRATACPGTGRERHGARHAAGSPSRATTAPPPRRPAGISTTVACGLIRRSTEPSACAARSPGRAARAGPARERVVAQQERHEHRQEAAGPGVRCSPAGRPVRDRRRSCWARWWMRRAACRPRRDGAAHQRAWPARSQSLRYNDAVGPRGPASLPAAARAFT